MKQITLFVIFVLVTGMMMSVYDDVFALSDKGKENGKAMGCEKGTAKNNPHCNNSSPLPENTCDVNLDGKISSNELPPDYGSSFITIMELIVALNNGDTNQNGSIDTLDEWNQVQSEQPGLCLN